MSVGSELRLVYIVIYMFGEASYAASHKYYSETEQLNWVLEKVTVMIIATSLS